MPNDAQRLDLIKRIVDDGHGERVVIAHDIFTKHRLVSYGGHGYGHILTNIRPTMRRKGFSDAEIADITEGNPARILALA